MLPIKVVITLQVFWITLIHLQAFIHFFMIAILKRKPVYLTWFGIRGTTALFYIWAFANTGVEWYPLLGFMLTSHMILFNPFLNKLRQLHNPLATFTFWYLGKDSGWFDKIFTVHPILYRIFYICCFLLMMICTFTIIEFYVTW